MKSYIYAILAVVLWATISPFSKLMLNTIPEEEFLFLTMLIATVTLFVINLITKKILVLRMYHIKDYLILFGLGALGIYLYILTYNMGIARLKASDACIINYLWPIMIVIFSVPILHEKMTLRKFAACLISFLGIVVVVTKFDFSNLEFESLPGVGCCLIAAVSYGLFSALNKKVKYDQCIAMMLFYFCATVLSGIQFIFSRQEYVPLMTVKNYFLIAWIGIVSNALGYLFWNMAIVKGETSKISNLAYICPFLTLLFSAVILKEDISAYAVIGLLLIVGGIFLQLKEKNYDCENGKAME